MARVSGGEGRQLGVRRPPRKAGTRAFSRDEGFAWFGVALGASVAKALGRDRTVISVAHRLSTLATFDRILVVEDGRIVEDGNATDLRRAGGLFDRMWRLQAEGLPRNEAQDAA